MDSETCGSAAQLKIPDARRYIQMVVRYPDVTRSIWCVAVEAGVHDICLSQQTTREVQLRISSGLASWHILILVNLFFRHKVVNTYGQRVGIVLSPMHNMTRLWDAPEKLCQTNQNSHPLIKINSPIVICIWETYGDVVNTFSG